MRQVCQVVWTDSQLRLVSNSFTSTREAWASPGPLDLEAGFVGMRGFLVLAVLICTLWAIDAVIFEARYRKAAWQEANYRGQKLNHQVQYWLKKSGL